MFSTCKRFRHVIKWPWWSSGYQRRGPLALRSLFARTEIAFHPPQVSSSARRWAIRRFSYHILQSGACLRQISKLLHRWKVQVGVGSGSKVPNGVDGLVITTFKLCAKNESVVRKLATIRTRSLAGMRPCWSRIILQSILPLLRNFDIQ
jgi:hypothetical protein